MMSPNRARTGCTSVTSGYQRPVCLAVVAFDIWWRSHTFSLPYHGAILLQAPAIVSLSWLFLSMMMAWLGRRVFDPALHYVSGWRLQRGN